MNACIKTGAVVHCLPTNLVFAADLFAVAGAIVVRANGPIRRGGNASPPPSGVADFCTHTLRSEEDGEEFWREDLGVFIVPARCVRGVDEA